MHGKENFKIIDTKQAKLINDYKHIKHKLLKTNAVVWFNKICRKIQLNYAKFKTKNNNQLNKNRKTSYKADGFVQEI